ncbi:hypothetical protein G7K_0650-t1 [Saitoella complicata NRRL Y-17804]|uniref:Uncharacterized protein n=1 Tax=Saitoella complicata (strain BCRC 22490 / CBS 7301 / JCM 7358 / NBRC 10748 / NRRL Y-17804) TaxID=698492 RepID=A0A0E9N9C9_SAICN|nr:hypothetical protein G7K_0650-t1 [Saitoella complicata NRRL Y-17804]
MTSTRLQHAGQLHCSCSRTPPPQGIIRTRVCPPTTSNIELSSMASHLTNEHDELMEDTTDMAPHPHQPKSLGSGGLHTEDIEYKGDTSPTRPYHTEEHQMRAQSGHPGSEGVRLAALSDVGQGGMYPGGPEPSEAGAYEADQRFVNGGNMEECEGGGGKATSTGAMG